MTGLLQALLDCVLELVLDLDEHLPCELDLFRADGTVSQEGDRERVSANRLPMVLLNLDRLVDRVEDAGLDDLAIGNLACRV